MADTAHIGEAIFYRRVSTKSQSFEMQIQAEFPHRSQWSELNVKTINDSGVSANKVPMKKRKGLMEVIGLVEQGIVKTVYVYDRSRLARNYYEYMLLVNLFLEYKVNVIFTTADIGYPPFSGNIFIEGFHAIMIEFEGKQIARRSRDTLKKLPVQKFGYIVTSPNGRKEYELVKPTHILKEMFMEAKQISSPQQFMEFITSYKKALNRKSILDVIKIIIDPFYAGCEKVGEEYNQLGYVQALVSLEEFKTIQSVIENYVNGVIRNVEEQNKQQDHQVKIYCHCGKQMKFRLDYFSSQGHYSCSSGHKKVSMTGEEIQRAIILGLNSMSQLLDVDKIRVVVRKQLNHLATETNKEIENIKIEIANLDKEIALMDYTRLIKKQHEKFKVKYVELHNQLQNLSDKLLISDFLKGKIDYIVNEITKVKDSNKTSSDLLALAPVLISHVEVYSMREVHVVHFYNEFMKKIDHLIIVED